MSSSNCCFLTCIQILSGGRSGGLVFPSLSEFSTVLTVIHAVKLFGVVDKAEVDVFLELSCFFDDPTDVGNLISGSTLPYNLSVSVLFMRSVDHFIFSFHLYTYRRKIIGTLYKHNF